MKPYIKLFLIIFLVTNFTSGQDSISLKQLQPLIYNFDIEAGKLVGDGVEFLKQELENAQFTMLGEYHGSKRISEFTNAIIPILNNANYKAMALEVGPITGKVLNSLNQNIADEINGIHKKYLMIDSDDDELLPFPFFSNKEDADFLQSAKDLSWNVFGIDQEFYDGYLMLSDMLYNNLSINQQEQHKDLYTSMVKALKQYYLNDESDIQNLHVALASSEVYQDFLKQTSQEVKNHEIVDALRQSSSIYLMYHKRQWYENNKTRILYMKSQLKKGLKELNFDLTEDKLLVKMGGYHLSKGFSPLGLYEVGNTLNELAEYHGNTALNIAFMSRFVLKDGQVIDNHKSGNKYYKEHKDLLQAGQKDQWVVIDLRPLIKGYFYYPKTFNLNSRLQQLVQRYDLLIIPKIEIEGTPNYN